MTYTEFIQSILESRENVYFQQSERHHITPRCMGGTDDDGNLIYLTYREHFIAHKLLHEENPENTDLAYAFMLMCRDKDRELTPEEFEEAKLAVCGLPQSKERVEKRAKKLRGQRRTLEQRKRIQESITRAMNTPEMKEKLSRSAKARVRFPHSEETRCKISEALRGKPRGPMSEESKKKISESIRGRKMPEEVRAKHRAENLSAETRKKLSDSHRGPMLRKVCAECGRNYFTKFEDREKCSDCNR